jgi:hypothetical protein
VFDAREGGDEGDREEARKKRGARLTLKAREMEREVTSLLERG